MGNTTKAKPVKYISISDAAIRTGISERTLRTYCATGLLQSIQVGRPYLIPEDALVSFRRPVRGTPSHADYKKSNQ